MAQLSEWLELMLAEISRREEEAQLNSEEEARRAQESQASCQLKDAAPAPGGAPPPASNAIDTVVSGERRRLRG